MMIFSNNGLIDLDAVRTMGVSVKKEGAFGYFGTGLKFAISTILRGGGSITIYRGETEHKITTVGKTIRKEDFEIVCLDGEQIGITTNLGRNWEPWMVLRELACNAMDEGGEFFEADEASPSKRKTTICVDWPELSEAYEQRGNLFLDRSAKPFITDETFEAFDRPSQFIYYRGIRVFKLEKNTALTYNLLAEQILTEDRNIHGTYRLDELVKEFLLKNADMAQVEKLITVPSGVHEYGFDFYDWETPSRAFLDTCLTLREANTPFNGSARKLMLRSMRQEEGRSGSSGTYHQITSRPLETAINVLDECGIELNVEVTPVVLVDELPGDSVSMAENGRIYILPRLIQSSESSIEGIAYELLRRWIDINAPLDTATEAVQLLAKPLFNQSRTIQKAREYEQAKRAEESEEEGEQAA